MKREGKCIRGKIFEEGIVLENYWVRARVCVYVCERTLIRISTWHTKNKQSVKLSKMHAQYTIIYIFVCDVCVREHPFTHRAFIFIVQQEHSSNWHEHIVWNRPLIQFCRSLFFHAKSICSIRIIEQYQSSCFKGFSMSLWVYIVFVQQLPSTTAPKIS